MRLHLLFLAPLLVLGHQAAYAQAAIGVTVPTDADVINRELGRGKGNLEKNVSGSPFLLPYWVRGNVKMMTGSVPRPLLKFDLASDRLLWRRPTGDSLQLDTSEITEFSLSDSLRGRTYTYRRYLDAKIESLPLRVAFFEVRYDAGRAALLRRRSRVLFKGNNGPSLAGHPGDKWVETITYFIKRADNVVEPTRLNSKSVLAVFGKAQAPALTAYTTREHLNLSEEADVIKLLQYYDTL